MIKAIGVLAGGFLSFVFITEGDVYAGMLVLIPTYAFAMKFMSNSIYGDFSKTAQEIKDTVEKRCNPAAYQSKLPENEKLALRAKRRREASDMLGRYRGGEHSSNQSAKPYSVVATPSCYSQDSLTSNSFMEADLDDVDFIIDEPLECISPHEEGVCVNTNGLPMLNGIGGVDVAGHMYGYTDSFISDSFDDSAGMLSDSCDTFGSDLGGW